MKYGFITKLVDFDGEKKWVAESTDLKGCIGQGDTIELAVAELEENESFWLEIAKNRGIVIPQNSVEVNKSEFSGKLTLRLGTRLHKETAERAKKDGISINQYIINAVVSYNSIESTAKVAERLIRKAEIQYVDRFHSARSFNQNIFDPKVATMYKFQQRS